MNRMVTALISWILLSNISAIGKRPNRYTDLSSVTQQEIDRLPAFPGAEGHGKYVTGGRGGRIIYVTNLSDDNKEGSFRYAINQSGPRIIMFKVSGTIKLTGNLNISNGDLTIAGQSAPGGGITLRDYPVRINSDNVIIRFIRFRMGDETDQVNDAIWGRECKDIIIDHCSISWSTDEVASFYDNENFTMQWCIISEALRNSIHDKGRHGYGGIWGGKKASFHHNIIAHNDSRNPRFNGSRYSKQSNLELVDFRNNILYNWGSNTVYGGEGGKYNIVNNYYKAGPATVSNSGRILQPYADDGSNDQPAGTYGSFYISGNIVTASSVISSNNWLGVNLHSSFNNYSTGTTLNDICTETEFESGEVTTHTAETGYERVLEFGGAGKYRDETDARVIKDITEGIATITDGGNGSTNGLIDTQSAVGGWPSLVSGEAPADTDNDGMPDEWEEQHNLDKFDPTDAQLFTVDGNYPNVEVYLYSLIDDITEGQIRDASVSAEFPGKNTINEPAVFHDSNTGLIRIKHVNEIRQIQVYTYTGSLILTRVVQAHETNFYVKEKGIVIIHIIDVKNDVYTKKISLF